VGDLGRMRFAYSPLVEVAESLYMLSSGSIAPVHGAWYGAVRRRLDTVDLELLQAVVPAHSYIADFVLPGATYPARTMASTNGTVGSRTCPAPGCCWCRPCSPGRM
jgi:hypothetical protein